MPNLSDDTVQSLAAALNRFEPKDIHTVLDDLGEATRRGLASDAITSGPLEFGSIEAGVLVYRGDDGLFRFRITVTEPTGAFYDELVVPEARLRGLVEMILTNLQARHAPKTPA